MGFFDNDEDSFENILNEFFGNPKIRRRSAGDVIHGEREERVVDYIEEEEFVYFIFEIPGYSKEDIDINVQGKELRISAIKENPESAQKYLISKLQRGVYFNKQLPNKIKPKNFEWNFNNGILEVKFKKK